MFGFFRLHSLRDFSQIMMMVLLLLPHLLLLLLILHVLLVILLLPVLLVHGPSIVERSTKRQNPPLQQNVVTLDPIILF